MHSYWQELLDPNHRRIESLFASLNGEEFLPAKNLVLRALERGPEEIRAVILGQDPYPTPGMAEGLAFSVPPNVQNLPASLRNIFREYVDDLGFSYPTNGHLGAWVESGVLLLNRVLTVKNGQPLSHRGIGWEEITDLVLKDLSLRQIPIICWGNQARTAAISNGFGTGEIFASAHPSPLSAYRGFFGSRPFSKVNSYLVASGKPEIAWRL